VIVFAINFMDRQILAILVEPIKHDLGLSDTQVGLLYGLAFAVLYTTAGIPIARYADRGNRARIINGSLVLFSLMSAACGLATTYWQLLLARIGVAIGEGGTGPPSQSIISDIYPVGQRSTALAIFSLGPHIGLILGFLLGGWVAQLWGWRAAFLVAGLAGLLFASVSFRHLNDPSASRAELPKRAQPPVLRSTLAVAFRCSSMRQIFFGASLFSIAVYALVAWLPSLLIRTHEMSIGAAGSVLALVLGLLGGAGTLAGGMSADHLGRRDAAWRLRIIAIVLLVMAPAWALVCFETRTAVMLVFLVLSGALLGFYLGPTFAMVQSLVEPGMRATAAALLILCSNVVGLGFGPIAVGALSDALSPHFGQDSLRLALLIVPPLCIWAAYHYHLAARTIAADLEDPRHA
jgi:predicted MFS family arabinose efflux permease